MSELRNGLAPGQPPTNGLVGTIEDYARQAWAGLTGAAAQQAAAHQGMTLAQRALDPAELQRAQAAALSFGPGTIKTWHGTGAKFAEFADPYIGTGQGSQGWGVGHYVAGAKRVAEGYVPEGGHLLEVNVKPDHEEFLDWDLPFSQQELGVQEKLRKIESAEGMDPGRLTIGEPNGEQIYFSIADRIYQQQASAIQATHGIGTAAADRAMQQASLDSEAAASRMLNEAGIPGNRYLDQRSRELPVGDPRRTHNYVVFDPKNLEIKTRDGIPLTPVDHDPFAGGQ